jgi:hypothetical protein
MGTDNSRGRTVKKTATPDSSWQRIWFSSRHREWSSLALVPSDSSVDIDRMAEMLTMTGRLHGERPVNLVKATGVRLEGVQAIVDAIAAMIERGENVIVPVDPVADNPAAIAILRACSAALLVVCLGESQLAAAQNTIEIVDRERFIGSVVIQQARHKQSDAANASLVEA